MLEIRLLGDIAILRNGKAVELPKSRKTLALLAYLAVTQRSHHRDRLCALLWELPDDPRGALRWSLSKLRSLVDEPDHKRIVSDRNSVGLELEGAGVDANSLRSELDAGGQKPTAEQLAKITGYLSGSFLENLQLPECREFQAWRTAERIELAELQLVALHTLLEKAGSNGKESRRSMQAIESLRQEFPELDVDTPGVKVDPLVAIEVSSKAGEVPKPDKPSIAVLPFENMSDDAGQDYFADGITDDVITALSRFSLFFVIARNSTFAYKHMHKDVKEIARELGVQYVLEGSVREVRGRIRITAQLIDATTGHHVWAERYDRQMDDVFEVQDDITEKIVTSIGPEVMSAEMNRAHNVQSRHPNARELYMRGMWHFSKFIKEENENAMNIAEEGIAYHPDDALLQTLLALTSQIDFVYGWKLPRQDSLHQAQKAAARAVDLDAHNPRVFRCLGVVELYSKRHDRAIAALERTIKLNPNDADGYALLGGVHGFAGNYALALENVQKAVRLSPRDSFLVNWYTYMAQAATIATNDDVALEWARKAIGEKPAFPGSYRVAAVAEAHLGDLAGAKADADMLIKLVPNTSLQNIRQTVPIKSETAMDRYLGALAQAGVPD